MATINNNNNSTNDSMQSSNNVPLTPLEIVSNSSSPSMFLVVNPLPSSDDELNDKILETVEKLRSKNTNTGSINNVPIINFSASHSNDSSSNDVPKMLQPTLTVLQCVINRNHVAVLLDDNRVCRFPFTVYAERINSNSQPESSPSSSSSSSIPKKCVYTQLISTGNINATSNTSGNNGGSGGSSSPRSSIPSRRRLVRRGGNRSSTSVIMGRSHMIPAQYVPEELVTQAQVVLQGKSRNVIIRELQRTNLDVNSAVNNLLSRDDEDFDDADDSPDQLIHSDDLISLLDTGFHNDHSVIIDTDFGDEVFSYPLRLRGSSNNLFPTSNSSSSGNNQNSSSTTSANNSSSTTNNSSSGSGSTNRFRLREDQPYPFIDRGDFNNHAILSKRWLSGVQESMKNPVETGRSKKKCDQIQLSPISFTDLQEYWIDNNDRKFVQIAALHSELIAINNNGQLCQWRWQDAEPFKAQTQDGLVYYHPRAPSLGLLSEKISLLSASVIRATVVTESNKVATWMDESVSMVAWKLEHSAANSIFTDVFSSSCSGSYKITSLYVSSLMSCVQLSSGTLYWWGTPPFSHRKKLAEKEKGLNEKSVKTKTKQKSSATTSNVSKENEIVQGTLVCMRNSPIYQAGAIAFTTAGGIPKIGQLITAAWKIADSYSFRVLTPQELQSRMLSTSASNTMTNYINCSGTTTSNNLSVPILSSSNNSSSKNLERSEMPPPPSPASSTSSESSSTNNAPSAKRVRGRNLSYNQQQPVAPNSNLTDDKNNSIDKTEIWNLRDVVFVEDVKNMPIGNVIKVDGNFVAVKFNSSFDVANSDNKNCDQQQSSIASRSSVSSDSGNIESLIQECRLLRKEDLVVVRTCQIGATSSQNTNNGSVVIGSKAFDYFQRTPKRVPIAEHMQILAMTLTNLGLHVIAKIGGYRLSYLQINIVSGRIEHDNKLSIEYSTFFGSGTNPKSSLIRLFSAGENEQTTVVLCRDGNGTLYPLAKDCTNTIVREPIALNLGPISSIGLGVFSLPNLNGLSGLSSSAQQGKTHAAILALTLKRQFLMPAILNSDLEMVRECLSMLSKYPDKFYPMISEVCDGNHNIIHIAVSACFPTTNNKQKNEAANIQLPSMDDDVEERYPQNDAERSPEAAPSNQQTSFIENTIEPLLDPTEQKPIAHSILWTLLDSPALSRHLFDLLSARDYQGLTPFMLAVSGRAYSAAQQIFVVMQRVARMISTNNESNNSNSNNSNRSDSTSQDIYQRAFTQMLYPRGSSPDHNPVYMLCSNDTCSFTWTGEEHINQDIFECRTCGLVGSLCCCTECARVCHRGHDCKLKRTSPTAYCDCWEKCKCKALIAGCQNARLSLVKRLLSSTDLSQRVNSRGEHILLFLVQTAGRQLIEQKQFRPNRTRQSFGGSSRTNKNETNEEQSNVPEHDLDPPKFVRKIMDKMLSDWPTVKSMILTGYRSSENQSTQHRRRSYLWNLNGTASNYSYEEENSYLSCQNGSALLDKFTHLLLKVGLNDAVDRMTSTIVQACKNPLTANEGRIVARRFVRSVIRVSLVVLFETNPIQYSTLYVPMDSSVFASFLERYLSVSDRIGSSASGSSSSSSTIPKKPKMYDMIRKIRRVFVALLPIACEELCEIAESLIAPVKLGLARPSSSFNMFPTSGSSSSTSSNSDIGGIITDELFSVDTSVYSHQRDFLDATFSLHDIIDESSTQDNLPSTHMLWNSYDTTNSELTSRTSGNRKNDENSNQVQNQPEGRSAANSIPNDVEVSNLSSDSNMGTTGQPSNPIIYDLRTLNESSSVASVPTVVVPSAQNQVPQIIVNEDHSNGLEAPEHHNSTSDADMVMEMLVANSEPDDNSNVGGRDTESDSESNPDDASYLSNADNASAQRSVVTGATAGSDVGVASLPYDDESLNSNPDDVDEDEDDEQDVEPDEIESSDSDDASDTAETEPDTDVLASFINDNVDRRMSGNAGSSSTNAVSGSNISSHHNILQHVQWALRNQRDHLYPGSNPHESASFRRNAGISNALVSMENVVQITNSMVGLARSFSIIVRHIADLMVILSETNSENARVDFPNMFLGPLESKQLLQAIEDRLRSTWSWLINCMDSTETQLRFGCALSNRRLAPSASTGSSVGSSSSANVVISNNSANAISAASFGNSNSRLSRIRSFQSQDEMAMLPTFNRHSLRRNNPSTYIFTRSSTNSTSANNSSGAGTSSNTGGGASSNTHVAETNQTANRDFINYAMSLMRVHSNEHYDSLPVLDVSSMKHVAYIFDAFVFFIRRGFHIEQRSQLNQTIAIEHMLLAQNEILPSRRYPLREENSGRNHSFFRRSNSTLYLGCPRPDPFSAPYHEALPLASKPQLLQPNARREQLFGIPRPSDASEVEEMLETLPSQMSLTKRHQWDYGQQPSSPTSSANLSTPPTRSQSVITESSSTGRAPIIQQQPNKLSVIVMAGSAKHQQQQNTPPNQIVSEHNYGTCPTKTSVSKISNSPIGSPKIYFFGNLQQQDILLGRWRLTLELFGRLFVDDVSLEPCSIIQELSGFPIKENKFRREMERLRISCSSSSSTQRDLNFLKLDRDRNALLIQTFKELNTVFSSVTRRLPTQIALVSQPLTITRVKVTFKDEPGEGTGVARSFYTAFSEAVLSNDKLPTELLTNNGNQGCIGGSRSSGASQAYDTYSSYVVRLRSHSSNNNGQNTNSSSGGQRSSSNGSSSSAPPPLPPSPFIDNSATTGMRRPRSPARYRPFYSTSNARRTQLIERIRSMHEPRSSNNSGSNNGTGSGSGLPSSPFRRLPTLRYDAPPFIPTQLMISRHSSIMPADPRTAFGKNFSILFQHSPVELTLGLRIYNRVYTLYPAYAPKITGMLLDIHQELGTLMNSDEDLRMCIDYAMELIQIYEGTRNSGSSPASSTSQSNASTVSITAQPAQSTGDSLSSDSSPSLSHWPTLAANADTIFDIIAENRSSRSNHKSNSEHSSSQIEYSDEEDNAPMFYQPGTRGFYSPRAGRCSENRLNLFRNVGRIIGVCFVQNELCPIAFNRHVIKMILGQPVAWHDLAFFDSQLYESLRQVILDAESNNKEEIFSECDFRFAIDLSPEEGGHEIELIPNGRNIRVTPQNVYDYVRRYAQYRMVESQEKAIMAIRAGIFDVIPSVSFDGLTPEDFRLLLNGVNEINVQQLQTYVTFYDESGDPDPLTNFRKWFWWVVERMTNEEKQDLIYFWTGSPALPASEGGFQPMPSVTIRPRDDYYFVSANTCISRLYIPLYSSRNILRQKLLMSIKSKTFGFV